EDGEVQVGEEGKEQPIEDGEGQVHEEDEQEVGNVGVDGEVEVAEEGEEVVDLGQHAEVEVAEEGTTICEHVVHEVGKKDGELGAVSEHAADGQGDVGGGVRDGQDEFDVSSWIGFDEDACVSEDDLVDVNVHGDEQAQEDHCQGSLFVDVGTTRGSNTQKKHV
ncbi:hypothetical protein V8G54_023290, partial [Vigna mungo]